MSAQRVVSAWLDPRDKPALFAEVVRHLAGDAHIAFEGDAAAMAIIDVMSIPGAVVGVTAPFARNWDQGTVLVSMPLDDTTIPLILQRVMPEARIVHCVHAISIAKNGRIEFLAADDFHRDCVSVGPAFDPSLLDRFVASGALWGYRSCS
jgi:hypothetical protein